MENSKNDTEQQKNNNTQLVDAEMLYKRLGVDVIALYVGEQLINYADPNGTPGDLLEKLAQLRQKLVDKYGYPICNIRIMDDQKLETNEYRIEIRGKEVFKSNIDINNIEKSEITTVISKNIGDICLKYVAQIFTQIKTLKIIELVKAQNPLLITDLIPTHISTYDLTRIFIKLLQQKVSIKDIIYIFELLNFHAQHTQDIDKLTELLIKDLNF